MNKQFLRIESLIVLAASIAAYFWLGLSWLLFAVLFLAPDIAMAGFLVNKKIGAKIYNLFHSYTFPALVTAAGYFSSENVLTGIGLIWIAHIAMDRSIGYGLKYETGFKDTHLHRI